MKHLATLAILLAFTGLAAAKIDPDAGDCIEAVGTVQEYYCETNPEGCETIGAEPWTESWFLPTIEEMLPCAQGSEEGEDCGNPNDLTLVQCMYAVQDQKFKNECHPVVEEVAKTFCEEGVTSGELCEGECAEATGQWWMYEALLQSEASDFCLNFVNYYFHDGRYSDSVDYSLVCYNDGESDGEGCICFGDGYDADCMYCTEGYYYFEGDCVPGDVCDLVPGDGNDGGDGNDDSDQGEENICSAYSYIYSDFCEEYGCEEDEDVTRSKEYLIHVYEAGQADPDNEGLQECINAYLDGEFHNGETPTCQVVHEPALDIFCQSGFDALDACDPDDVTPDAPIQFFIWLAGNWPCASTASCTEADLAEMGDSPLPELATICMNFSFEGTADCVSMWDDFAASAGDVWTSGTLDEIAALVWEDPNYVEMMTCMPWELPIPARPNGADVSCGGKDIERGHFDYASFTLEIRDAASLCVEAPGSDECTPLLDLVHEWGDDEEVEDGNQAVENSDQSASRRARRLQTATATAATGGDDSFGDDSFGDDSFGDDSFGDDSFGFEGDYMANLEKMSIPVSEATSALAGAMRLNCETRDGDTFTVDSTNGHPERGFPTYFFPVGHVDDPSLFMAKVGEKYQLPVTVVTEPVVISGVLPVVLQTWTDWGEHQRFLPDWATGLFDPWDYDFGCHSFEHDLSCSLEFNDGTWDDFVDSDGVSHPRPIVRTDTGDIPVAGDDQVFDGADSGCNSDDLSNSWVLLLDAIELLKTAEDWEELETYRQAPEIIRESKYWKACSDLHHDLAWPTQGRRKVTIPRTKMCPAWFGADWEEWKDDPCCERQVDQCCLKRDITFEPNWGMFRRVEKLDAEDMSNLEDNIGFHCSGADMDEVKGVLDNLADDMVKDWRCQSTDGGHEFWEQIHTAMNECEQSLQEQESKECSSEGQTNACLAGCDTASNKCISPYNNVGFYWMKCLRAADLPAGFLPFLEAELAERAVENGYTIDEALEGDEYFGELILAGAGNDMCVGKHIWNGVKGHTQVKWDPDCDDEEHYDLYDWVCPRHHVEVPYTEEECLAEQECNWMWCHDHRACIADVADEEECASIRTIDVWYDDWEELCRVSAWEKLACENADIDGYVGTWFEPCDPVCQCVLPYDKEECKARQNNHLWFGDYWECPEDGGDCLHYQVCYGGAGNEEDCLALGMDWDEDKFECIGYGWDEEDCSNGWWDSNSQKCVGDQWDSSSQCVMETEGCRDEMDFQDQDCWNTKCIVTNEDGSGIDRRDCAFLDLQFDSNTWMEAHWENWGAWADSCRVSGLESQLECEAAGFSWTDNCQAECEAEHLSEGFCADCSWGDENCWERSQFGKCRIEVQNSWAGEGCDSCEDECTNAGGVWTDSYNSWGEWECIDTDASTQDECLPASTCGAQVERQMSEPGFSDWGHQLWCDAGCYYDVDATACNSNSNKMWTMVNDEYQCVAEFHDVCACVNPDTTIASRSDCSGDNVQGWHEEAFGDSVCLTGSWTWWTDDGPQYCTQGYWDEELGEDVLIPADVCYVFGNVEYGGVDDGNGEQWSLNYDLWLTIPCDSFEWCDIGCLEELAQDSTKYSEATTCEWVDDAMVCDVVDTLPHLEADFYQYHHSEMKCGWEVDPDQCGRGWEWDDWRTDNKCRRHDHGGNQDECEALGGEFTCTVEGVASEDEAREALCADMEGVWQCLNEWTWTDFDADGEEVIHSDCHWHGCLLAGEDEGSCEQGFSYGWDHWRDTCMIWEWEQANCPTWEANVSWQSGRSWFISKYATEEDCTSAGSCRFGWDSREVSEEECGDYGSCSINCPTCAPSWEFRDWERNNAFLSICELPNSLVANYDDCNRDETDFPVLVDRNGRVEWDEQRGVCWTTVHSSSDCPVADGAILHSCHTLSIEQCKECNQEDGCEVDGVDLWMDRLHCSVDPWAQCPKSKCTDARGDCDDWELSQWNHETQTHSSGVCRVKRDQWGGCEHDTHWMSLGCALSQERASNAAECEDEGGEWVERAKDQEECLATKGCRARGEWHLTSRDEETCMECGGKYEPAYRWHGAVWSDGQFTPFSWLTRTYSVSNQWTRTINETTVRHIVDTVVARTLAADEAASVMCSVAGDWRYLRQLGCLCGDASASFCSNQIEEEIALPPTPVNSETCAEFVVGNIEVATCEDVDGVGTVGGNIISIDAAANTAATVEGETESTVQDEEVEQTDEDGDESIERRLKSYVSKPYSREAEKESKHQRRARQLRRGLQTTTECSTYESVLNSNNKIVGQIVGDFVVASFTGDAVSAEFCVDKTAAVARPQYTEAMWGSFADNKITVDDSIVATETDTQICGTLPAGTWGPLKVVPGYANFDIALCGDAAPTAEQNAASSVSAEFTADLDSADCADTSSAGVTAAVEALATAAGVDASTMTATSCSATGARRQLAESSLAVDISGTEDFNAQVIFEAAAAAVSAGEVAGVTGATATSISTGCSACEATDSTVTTAVEESGGVADAAVAVSEDGTVSGGTVASDSNTDTTTTGSTTTTTSGTTTTTTGGTTGLGSSPAGLTAPGMLTIALVLIAGLVF